VRDANNNFVSGVAITFKSTSGGLTVVNGTTDTNGAATATLNAASDPTNRTITVTASAGQTSATLDVPVVGTALSVTGAPSLVIGSQGTYNVSLTDSSGKPIAGQSVALTSSAGNTLSAASVTTDVSGHATLQLTAAKAGTDTLTAKTLGLTATQTVVVSGQSFVFTSPAANTKVDLGASLTLIVNWKSTGTPQVGQTVNFASTRGILAPASAVTDASGNATVHISSTTSGPAIISATGTGVTATLAVDFVATNPTALDLQANSATIAIQGQSTISAIVRDPANNLVEGQTVSFQLTDITGGSLSVASAQTDIQGRAQTVYTASSAPSASNGVTVTAIVQGKPAVTGSATLTVGGQTVFLSLGTGVKLQENAPATQFTMPWVLQAVDSAGNPVNNVPVTLTIHSVSYYKGTWVAAGSDWVWTPTSPACANEDVNLNGVLDPGEDFNGNHKLDPGEVAVTTVGTVTTAADGSATFGVEYPEDHAVWVIVNLTATANVQGTQASTNSIFQLPMLSSYVTTAPSAIPGEVSPYGVNVSCANPN
jgi:Bacterial Ig-like domain (group 1)